jgi:hypothetical protein
MTKPFAKTPAATFLLERMRDLKHRKSHKEIALEADPAYLMRLRAAL